MCGRAYQPRFLWMWPNARISVMGGNQAANVMSTLKADQAEHDGSSITHDDIKNIQKPIIEKFETEGHPYYASARIWDDGIIDPRDTRKFIIQALNAVQNSPIPDPKPPVFRM